MGDVDELIVGAEILRPLQKFISRAMSYIILCSLLFDTETIHHFFSSRPSKTFFFVFTAVNMFFFHGPPLQTTTIA
jgi:hypothetical protein